MLASVGKYIPQGIAGFLLYTIGLILLVASLPAITLDGTSHRIILFAGTIAIWRYGWGLVHYIRFLVYTRIVFPGMRKKVDAKNHAPPSHIYILLTSFRIDAATSVAVYRAAISEAIDSGTDATLICSFVELSDEFLMKKIYAEMAPPNRVRLQFVRIPGQGKRSALAEGFRAIAQRKPTSDALTIVLDGDSMMSPGTLQKCMPFFASYPKIGALTTDEDCIVHGSRIMKEWHHLRFAQRQILMASMALSRRVLTLTGRMSIFRASITSDPDFINTIENDYLQHWRLGTFKFLTGDDKSSWFWVLKNNYEMLYVPDATVITAEHPPSPHFIKASTMLMTRWFGNMLRTNGRALALGPRKTGFFTWWCLLDQRLSMWTSLIGPVIAVLLTLKHTILILPAYLVWLGATRWIMSVMLLASRPVISWYYPFLIYYNQVWGALIKTYVFFHLDRQSWTRQKIALQRGLSDKAAQWMHTSSHFVHGISLIVFVALIGLVSGVLNPTF